MLSYWCMCHVWPASSSCAGISNIISRGAGCRKTRGIASSIPVKPIVKDPLFAFAHKFRERKVAHTIEVEPEATFFGERDDLIELTTSAACSAKFRPPDIA